MGDEKRSQDLSLWQRYRRPALTALAAAVVVVVLRVAFPDTDFSRGSAARWWLIAGLVVVALIAVAVRGLLRRRRDAETVDERSS